MKRLIALCLACILLFVVRPIDKICAVDNGLLSGRTDEEILAFLDKYDIEIPEGFKETDAEIYEVVRWWIERVENDPYTFFGYNHPITYNFANAVKDAVNSYYGVLITAGGVSSFTRYVLQQSTLWSTPSNAYSFNCYAYALGRSDDDYYPGYFSVGEFEAREIDTITSSQLADRVIADLTQGSLNKKCAYKTTIRPAYDDLLSGQVAICVRKGVDDRGNGDYHFARLFYETENEYGDAWRHKPKISYVLQFISYPSHSTPWVAEVYQANGAKLDETGLTYSGTIYYIIYKSNCNNSNYTLIREYHQGTKHFYEYTRTCADCGKTYYYKQSEVCLGDCGYPGVIPRASVDGG